MSDRPLVVVGATGLVGRTVVRLASEQGGIRLGAVARREFPLPRGVRMELIVAPPEGWEQAVAALCPETLIVALGTTWRKSGGDEAAFRAVDHDLVLASARAARDSGARQLIFVSAAGANALSRNLYMRVKGETEQALIKMRFPRLDILRPGLIRGRRMDDMRPLEKMAMLASPLVDLALVGGWREYRSISAVRLASAILSLANEKAGGRFFHGRDALLRAARRYDRQTEPKSDGAGEKLGLAERR